MFTESEYFKFVVEGAESPGDIARMLQEEADRFVAMDKAGIVLQDPVDDGWAHFSTNDYEVAKRFHFRADDDDAPIGMKEIDLGNRTVTYVEDEDYDAVRRYEWRTNRRGDTVAKINGREVTLEDVIARNSKKREKAAKASKK